MQKVSAQYAIEWRAGDRCKSVSVKSLSFEARASHRRRLHLFGRFEALQKAAGNFPKTLKIPIGSGGIRKDNTLTKNHSTYEQEFLRVSVLFIITFVLRQSGLLTHVKRSRTRFTVKEQD